MHDGHVEDRRRGWWPCQQRGRGGGVDLVEYSVLSDFAVDSPCPGATRAYRYGRSLVAEGWGVEGMTSLHRACSQGFMLFPATLFIIYKAEVNRQDIYRQTAPHRACVLSDRY